MDPEDESLEETARREAYEEVGLSRDKEKAPLLCRLPPFLSRFNNMSAFMVSVPRIHPSIAEPFYSRVCTFKKLLSLLLISLQNALCCLDQGCGYPRSSGQQRRSGPSIFSSSRGVSGKIQISMSAST